MNQVKLASLLLLLVLVITSCHSTFDNCNRSDPDVPYGYWESSRYEAGEYISITYTNGKHFITYTSVDECDDWERSDYWVNY